MTDTEYTAIPLVPDDAGTLSIGVHEAASSNSCNSIAYPLLLLTLVTYSQ